MLCTVVGMVAGLATFTAAQTSRPVYSPARPPAVPLAVRSPYTSAWSSTSGGGTLNTNGVMFWPGNPLGWEGIVAVDGVSYEYLGMGSQDLPTLPNLKSATPLTVSYDSQYSNFTFQAGPVQITASFLSAVIPKDLCRTSIPLSYLTTSVQSTDGGSHDVQFYSDINGAWAAFENNVTLKWDLFQGSQTINGTASNGSSPLYTWLLQLRQPYEFGEEMQVPQWGNMTWTTEQQGASNFSYSGGEYSATTRFSFVNSHSLDDMVSGDYRGFGAQEPAFAFAHDFGNVSSASVMYTLGSVQTPIIRYLTTGGVVGLQPWWTQCYGDIFQMISYHWSDFNSTAALAYDFEMQLQSDIDTYYAADRAMVYGNNTSPGPATSYGNGTSDGQQYVFDPNTAYGFLNANNFSGVAIPEVSEAESYYSIVALSARQVMGAYVFAIPPGTTGNASEPLMFQKEISSDGNVNTVDVMYPAMPFFLYANPELVRYNLEPLMYNQESGFYPNGYSMHDLGTNFPNATGHVEGNDEYMPVEESGNMLLMATAYYKFSGNSSFLHQHYPLLQQFASYLIQYSLIPGVQLSTDDFAGSLANQTNLAIKGIVGLQAMSLVSGVVGDSAGAANYSSTAASYYQQWTYLGIDPSGSHTLLAYQWRSSWGTLYNIFPDKLLNLGIIPQSLYDMQSAWYPQVSQVFGVPLDVRHDYTKSDWEMWTAATCSPSTRRLFVNALAYWLNNTDTNMAFTDLYVTVDGGSFPTGVQFTARPVVGGHFSLLALLRAGESETAGTSNANSSFPVNSTQALSSEIELPTQATLNAVKRYWTVSN